MADKSRKITPSNGGVFQTFSERLRLILRLMGDRRVHPLLKLLPVGALLYLFIPDFPGPLDDALLLWLGGTVFVELCPPAIVQEHEAAIRRTGFSAGDDIHPDDVIDAESRDIDSGVK